MAMPAAEPVRGRFLPRLRDIVAPQPGRTAFAVRIALICTLTVLVGEINGIPEIALAAYVVFFMNNADRTRSVLAATLFLLLTNVLIGTLILVAGQVLDWPALRLLAMVGFSVVLLFLASASRLKPLAPIIAMILVYALDAIGRLPGAELATRALLYAWLLIALPSAVPLVVNLLIGPAPVLLARQRMATALRDTAKLLRQSNPDTRARLQAQRGQGSATVLALLHVAGLGKEAPLGTLAALRAAASTTEALLMLGLAIDASEGVPDAWKHGAAERLDGMAAIFAAGSHPVDITAVAFDAQCASTPVALLQDFNALLVHFATDTSHGANAPPAPSPGFLAADAWTNPAHVRHALKVTAAAMLCYLFYSATEWQGIHTSLITCYMVALGSTAETTEKLLLRITGAVAGAIVGLALIVWVLPELDDIGGLLALVAGAAFVGGWIVASGPRVGYIGFQFSFAVFLCVIQGTAPAFDLAVARDRIVGILIGNAVVYLMFAHVWPVSIAGALDSASAALLRQLVRLARMPADIARLKALAAVRAQAQAIAHQLEVAGLEPRRLRKPSVWFTKHEQVLREAAAAEQHLLLEPAAAETCVQQLQQLADTLDHSPSGDAVDTPGAARHAN